MLVAINNDRRTGALWDGDGHDLFRKDAARGGGCRALLRCEGEFVLRLAADVPLISDTLRRFAK